MRLVTNTLLRSIAGLVGLGFVVGGGLVALLLLTGHGQCHATVQQDISTHTQCHEINGTILLGLVMVVVGIVAIIASRVGVSRRDRGEFHVAFRPGWYTDLQQPDKERWWDGTEWTTEMRIKQE
jgi:hypothetical protein